MRSIGSIRGQTGPALGGGTRRLVLSAGLAALLAGCATYKAAPLPTAPAAFPGQDDLNAAAARLKSSRLRPVTIDLGQPLTPDELALIAVIASPALKAARAKAGVAAAQAFQAGLLPDPTLSLGIDRPYAGPDTITALSSALGFDLSSLYEHKVIKAQADAAAEQAHLDLAWQEWQTAGQARLLAARIIALEAQQALAVRARKAADEMLRRVLDATARGDLKADDLEPRRIAAAEAADRARNGEKDLVAARGDLNKLLGLAPDIALVLAAPRPPAAAPDAGRLFEIAKSGRLDLAALRSGYASEDAKLRQAILEQYPKLNLTVNHARDTAGVKSIGAAIDFTLPLWNRNRGAIAVETATREQLRAEYGQRLSDTRAEIAALIDNITILRRQRADIEAQTAPLRTLAEATEAAARRGDLADSVADSARQSVIDKEIALAAIDQAVAEQDVTLELAVGTLRETW